MSAPDIASPSAARVPPPRALPSGVELPASLLPPARRGFRALHWTARRLGPTEGKLLFLGALSGYLYVAQLFLAKGVIFGDALSRVANAYWVVYSRDPHLAAVGFTWNPLPSLVLVPFLWLKDFFPVLTTHGFIIDISTAVFMAGAVAMLAGILREMGVPRLPRLLITLLFAADPMIIIYGANGMSEALMLFFVLLAARGLTVWLARDRPSGLVVAGVALFFAYQVRYETVGAALFAIGVVAVVGYFRPSGGRRPRITSAATEASLVAMPFLASFGLFALASKVIVNQWFPTFSSSYGNTQQVSDRAAYLNARLGVSRLDRLHHLVSQMNGLEPFLVALLILALWISLARWDVRPLGAALALGGVYLFDLIALVSGDTYGNLRFNITLIPLACIAAGAITVPWPARRRLLPHIAGVAIRASWLTAAAIVAVGLLALELPSTVSTLTNPRLSDVEGPTVIARMFPAKATPSEIQTSKIFPEDRQISAQIDGMHLPPASVLTDVADSFAIVLASRDPGQYVITPDRDFERDLADPNRWGIRYLLVPAGYSVVSYDAVLAAFPDLNQRFNGWAKPVKVWKGPVGFTLYQITGQAPYGLDTSNY